MYFPYKTASTHTGRDRIKFRSHIAQESIRIVQNSHHLQDNRRGATHLKETLSRSLRDLTHYQNAVLPALIRIHVSGEVEPKYFQSAILLAMTFLHVILRSTLELMLVRA